jgi:hypothetical protein
MGESGGRAVLSIPPPDDPLLDLLLLGLM